MLRNSIEAKSFNTISLGLVLTSRDGGNTMSGRCSLGGHKIYFNEQDNQWHYNDNDEIVDKCAERPCIKCNKKPTSDGHDYCIANLGKVLNACCGHGTSKGYVQFDNGIIIRGYFEVEKHNDGEPE